MVEDVSVESQLNQIVYRMVKKGEYPVPKPSISDAAFREEQSALKAERIPRPATKAEYLQLISKLETQITEISAYNIQIALDNKKDHKSVDEKMEADLAAIKEDSQVQWISIRTVRTAKLADCDWTQIPDAPLSEEQRKMWQEYRQKLRDLPADQYYKKPSDIVWPQQPGK